MDKRTLIAVILSLIVLLGWSYLFKQKQLPMEPMPEQQAAAPLKTAPPARTGTVKPVMQIPGAYPSAAMAEANDVVVETDLYKAVFSTGGAIVKYWELKTYKDKDDMPVVLLAEPGPAPALGIIFEGPNRNLPQEWVYTVNTKRINLSGSGSAKGELVFTYSSKGMSIIKRFVFYNDDFKIDFSLKAVNTPSFMLSLGTDFGIFDKEGGSRSHSGPVILVNTDKTDFTEKSENKYLTGDIRWIAQEDQYFTAAIIPIDPVEGASVWKEKDSPEIALNLAPQKYDFTFYVGPKEYDRLKALNAGLEYLVDFGWFSIVAMPLFWTLKFFYKYMGNYGWAIIFLTILVRVPFIPILHKSQQSMKKMQKIQPLMAELKEKYKNDSVKMQKEMMQLYKKHKVNPVGGCLPMFLQIPVFIALYNVLLKAIELRGAPFVLWITDLAAKDPYYVLPIIMGITMVIQQKMTPTAMDPKQAKMMMLMPIVFTFMFLQFAAGLVLYWLVNNILGIIQQYYANKKAA